MSDEDFSFLINALIHLGNIIAETNRIKKGVEEDDARFSEFLDRLKVK